MPYKILLALLGILNFSLVIAQKPVRKGVKPIQKEYIPAKPKYNIGQLSGKWQEVYRSKRENNEQLSFTDSLQIWIKGNNAELREGNSMNMNLKGQVRISAPNLLEIAGDTYSLLSLSNNQLVIDDGEFRRTMRKTNRFYFETLGKIKIESEEYSTPIVALPSALKGKWVVYRRQAAPGFINSNSILIKSIDISADSAGRYATGVLSFYQKDLTQSQPVKISFEGNNMLIQSKDQTWNVFLYKASGNELVFGKEGELVYYAKPL